MKKEWTTSLDFQNVEIESIEGTNATKRLQDVPVSIDKKKYYVGNWSGALKDIEELEVDNRHIFFVDRKRGHSYHCMGRVVQSFQDMILKAYGKSGAKKDVEIMTGSYSSLPSRSRPGGTSRKAKRRAFGKRGKELTASSFNGTSTWLDSDGDDDGSAHNVHRNVQDMKKEEETLVEEAVTEPQQQEPEDDSLCWEDSTEPAETKTPKNKRPKKGQRRLWKESMAASLHDSETDDDFEYEAKMTTPAHDQRVVSPLDGNQVVENMNDKNNKKDEELKTKGQSTLRGFFVKKETSSISTTQRQLTQDKEIKASKTKSPLAKSEKPAHTKHFSVTPKGTSSLSPPRRKQQQTPFWSTPSRNEPKINMEYKSNNKSPTNFNQLPLAPEKAKLDTSKVFQHISSHDKNAGDEQKKHQFSPMKMSFLSLSKKRKLTPPDDRIRMNRFQNALPLDTESCRHKGLQNMGNTCYLNSSLQMLYTVRDFVDSLEASKVGPLVRSIVSTAKKVLDVSKPGAISPRELKSEVDRKTSKFRGYQQRDAHEFLGDLLDNIHEELVEEKSKGEHSKDCLVDDQTKEAPGEIIRSEDADLQSGDAASNMEETELLPTDEYFRCDIEVCLTCTSCGYSRNKKEMYRHLSLDISHHEIENNDIDVSVQKCLELFFKAEEREITCEKCTDGKTASQSLRLLTHPKALLLHLKRFVIDVDKGDPSHEQEGQLAEISFRKNKAPVELSEKISIDEFLEESKQTDDSKDTNTYKLKSCVYHIGSSASSGHYTADAIRQKPEISHSESLQETGARDEEWVSFDDSSTSITSLTEIVRDEHRKTTAYMLLYTMD